MPRSVEIAIEQADILTFDADVVTLKYNESFYGVAQIVSMQLMLKNIPLEDVQPPVGSYRFIETQGAIQAPYLMVLGVVRLRDFRYEQVRDFSIDALKALAKEMPSIKHIAMTVHGVDYGLDENEAVLSQLGGCLEALKLNEMPAQLERISIVDINAGRINRFRHAIDQYMPTVEYTYQEDNRWFYRVIEKPSTAPASPTPAPMTPKLAETPAPIPRTAPPAPKPAPVNVNLNQPGIRSDQKPHAFIAMPFKKEMEDVFYYGIQQPVQSIGLLCERVDKTEFTGEIMEYVRSRIETASVLIAELTGANPNVYLEVGYGWGKGRPTILLVSDEQELQFDVRGQRCLAYSTIRELENMLGKELKGMINRGIIKL